MYISASIGWLNLDTLPADQLGNFLEGALAPLVFLWLAIGCFLQQKELQQNTEARQQQSEQMADHRITGHHMRMTTNQGNP